MDANKLNKVSFEEYVAIEQANNAQYEFHDGTVTAMAGGTVEHGLICGNVFGEIKFGLKGKEGNCIAINSEVKLHIATSNKFLYPDAMVVCGEIEKSVQEQHAITNPIVIIEVLSKSTESYDRGDKFFAYRQIASLQEYILINQYKAQVDLYKRAADLWNISRIEGIDQTLHIASIGLNIPLKDIYENVVFSENNIV